MSQDQHPELSREALFVLLRVLRVAAGIAAPVTTCLVALVVPDSTPEFLVLCAILILGWAAYLYAFRRNPPALLLAASLLLCVALFALVADNLLAVERVLGFRVSNKLELSPRLVRWAASHAKNPSNTWAQFGADPMFYTRRPGSFYRDRYDYRNYGEEYVAVVDNRGYLDGDPDFYDRSPAIDVFIAGGSVLEGIGMPGVIADLRTMVPGTIYSLSMGSYTPRQKVDALKTFGLPKHPKWLTVEFNARNDASGAIEDDVCRASGQDYLCLFDFPLMARVLSEDARYRSFGDFGDFSPLMQWVRHIRSDSLTLAFARAIAVKVRALAGGASAQKVVRLNGEALSFPASTHFPVHQDQRLEWTRTGLKLVLGAYTDLIANARKANAKVMVLYNPTSYEIYREVLPADDIDAGADAISDLQRTTLAQFAKENNLAFCDLTDSFRSEVRAGARGLFGHNDGTHWTEKGRALAARLLAACAGRTWRSAP